MDDVVKGPHPPCWPLHLAIRQVHPPVAAVPRHLQRPPLPEALALAGLVCWLDAARHPHIPLEGDALFPFLRERKRFSSCTCMRQKEASTPS